ncbi:sarcosine oxidase subunit delta [Bradyrhizobium sp. ERR14]|uniref:sarcosine oxidase subunit delta n=1 Tax=Bradyrhizobium sp. ERR14 TaxID=2663837 RepID=UPI0016126BA4|nr:sarcosine oxidase subunit delta [Bradyrhizobium sp. ERR14]MBB4398502.1 sarcosine oxidase subunit delta [Bradyrhizobium sp. ERR14]
MRIACPHCGLRDVQEFTYHGDAKPRRPDGLAATEAVMFEYVYLRDNPPGLHQELWYHGSCRAWLIVHRDTVTHAIESVMLAKDLKVGGAA